MENNNQNLQSASNSNTSMGKQVLPIILAIGGLVIGLTAGVLIGKGMTKSSTVATQQQEVTIPAVKTEDPRQLLDPIELLKSPIFTEWKGSVEGDVVKKDKNSFVIEKNGRQLTVFLQESLTGFYKEAAKPTDPLTQITFAALNVGDHVSGGVTIQRGSLDNDKTHHVFADVFTVLNENKTSQ